MTLNWTLSKQEREDFTRIFHALNPVNGKLSSLIGRDYLVNSNLPIPILAKIWNLADRDEDGYLALNEFIIAGKLISLCSNGLELPNNLSQEFIASLYSEDIPIIISPKSTSDKYANLSELFSEVALTSVPSNIIKQELSISNSSTIFNPSDVPNSYTNVIDNKLLDASTRYRSLFNNTTSRNISNKVSADEARSIFLQSGLSKNILAKIWEESDKDMDGQLSEVEFATAISLIEQHLNGYQFNPTFSNMVPSSNYSKNSIDMTENFDHRLVNKITAQPQPMLDVFSSYTENVNSKSLTEQTSSTLYSQTLTTNLNIFNEQLEKDILSANSTLNELKTDEQTIKSNISNIQHKIAQSKEHNERINAEIKKKELSLVNVKLLLQQSKVEKDSLKSINKETKFFNDITKSDKSFTQNKFPLIISKSTSNVDLFFNPQFSPSDPFRQPIKSGNFNNSSNLGIFAQEKSYVLNSKNTNDKDLIKKNMNPPLSTTINLPTQIPAANNPITKPQVPSLPLAASQPSLNHGSKPKTVKSSIKDAKHEDSKSKSLFRKLFNKNKSKNKLDKVKPASQFPTETNKPFIPPRPNVNIPSHTNSNNPSQVPRTRPTSPPFNLYSALPKEEKPVPRNLFVLPDIDPNQLRKYEQLAISQKQNDTTKSPVTTSKYIPTQPQISMDRISKIAQELENTRFDDNITYQNKQLSDLKAKKEVHSLKIENITTYPPANHVSEENPLELVVNNPLSTLKIIDKEKVNDNNISSSEEAEIITHTPPLEFVAINNYDSSEVEFSFQLGDKLSILFENEEYFYAEINGIGDWFPKFYVKKSVPSGFLEKYEVKGYFKALYDNEIEQDDDLAFCKDDILIQIKEMEEWIFGYSCGKEGLFPKIYAEPIYHLSVKEIRTVSKRFIADHDCELSIEEDSTVAILHINGNGWCVGILENQHKIGFFPPLCS